jgi:hypothetical protein
MPTVADPVEAQTLFQIVIESRFLTEATALLVCADEAGHPLAHIHLVECDPHACPTALAQVLDAVLERLSNAGPPALGSLALGLTRPGDEHVQSYDRAWFKALHRVCHSHGLLAYGVYVVTRTGVRAVHIDDAA